MYYLYSIDTYNGTTNRVVVVVVIIAGLNGGLAIQKQTNKDVYT